MAFTEVFVRLDFTLAQQLMVVTFSPMDLLAYGIATDLAFDVGPANPPVTRPFFRLGGT